MKTKEVFGKGRLRKNYHTEEEWPGLQTSSALPGTDWKRCRKVYCSTATGQRHFWDWCTVHMTYKDLKRQCKLTLHNGVSSPDGSRSLKFNEDKQILNKNDKRMRLSLPKRGRNVHILILWSLEALAKLSHSWLPKLLLQLFHLPLTSTCTILRLSAWNDCPVPVLSPIASSWSPIQPSSLRKCHRWSLFTPNVYSAVSVPIIALIYFTLCHWSTCSSGYVGMTGGCRVWRWESIYLKTKPIIKFKPWWHRAVLPVFRKLRHKILSSRPNWVTH